MPNKLTFQIKPIREFVLKYLKNSKISIDPFARNENLAHYTNDLNPNTSAQYHLECNDFLDILISKNMRADLIIFDPPYSTSQVKECYEGIGLKFMQTDVWKTAGWTKEKDRCNRLLDENGVFLYFGWNTTGMGKKRNYEIEEILIVNCGACHNDYLCMAERKLKNI